MAFAGRCFAIVYAAVSAAAGSTGAWAMDEQQFKVVRRLSLPQERLAPADPVRATYRMRLSIVVVSGSGWRSEEVLESALAAAGTLGQCAIRTEAIDLEEIDAPRRYRSLFTPVSRELAARLALRRPAVLFLADTRHRPAFDAEAIGRGNSRTRPEMADTVWIVRGARDLETVIAHELAHVLADSGEHSDEPGNLMREETAPGGTRLTPAQCDKIVKTGVANGLLRPQRP